MIEARRNYIWVGGFVVAALVCGIVWIAVLAGGTGATEDYWIRYDTVMGLSPGTQILSDGYPVGVIEGISPRPLSEGGGFRLNVSVDKEWAIPVDSQAVVTSGGLLSAVVVNIVRGASREMLEPGSEIPGDKSPGLMAALSSVARQVEGLANDIGPVLSSLEASVPEILDDMRGLTERLNTAADRLISVLSEENANRVAEILVEIQSTTANAAELSGDLGQTRDELDRVIGSAHRMLEETRPGVRGAVLDLETSLAVVADHMSAVTRNLESTLRNMNEFSAQLREEPRSLIFPTRSDGTEAE